MGEDVPGTGLMINCLLANKTKICNPIKTNRYLIQKCLDLHITLKWNYLRILRMYKNIRSQKRVVRDRKALKKNPEKYREKLHLPLFPWPILNSMKHWKKTAMKYSLF